MRLFCFPHAGGGRFIFQGWSAELAGQLEIVPVALPGRDHRFREPRCRRLIDLVELLARELAGAFELPFAFFGHSMGAMIAFELARHLRRQHRPGPDRLLIASRRAPHLPDRHLPIHDLPDDAFLKALRQRYDGIPAPVLENSELMALFLPVLKDDIAMLETYAYAEEAPLDCPISAFGGSEDSSVDRAELDAWRTHTTRSFCLRLFPGDHFFLKGPTRRPLLQALAESCAP